MEAEWEKTEEFHELWKLKSREMLARAEWRRRKLTKRVHRRRIIHCRMPQLDAGFSMDSMQCQEVKNRDMLYSLRRKRSE